MKKLLTLASIVVLCLGLIPAQPTHAALASDWSAGDIIADNIFTYAGDMSVTDIQNFLNGLVPNCDTWGTQPATDWGAPSMTHAQYAASRGWPGPPYVCLKEYYEVPKTAPSSAIPDNSYNHYDANTQTLLPVPGGVSAAQLIYNAAQQYNINPKVLLVMIQKESAGPLTQDTWPLASQYKYPLGAHCPDTTGCDPNYSGFSIQISESAALLRWYLDNMNQPWWPYKKPGVNSIQFNPSTSCGASNVNVTTYATGALYTYTPYQPNAAAINNLYGLGDSCSSYGNRNFWRIYTDWFGRTNTISIPGCYIATNTSLSCVWKVKNNQTGAEILSTSYSTVYNLVNGPQTYSFMGQYFVARNSVAPQAGNIPVYGLRKTADSSTYLTVDPTEYASLKTSGYIDDGILFYADPPGSNSGYPVYKLYNSSTGQYEWTQGGAQYTYYLQSGFVSQGIAFTALSSVRQETAPPAGKLLVYRFYIPESHSHLWTTDIYERDNMIQAGYQYEGVAWYSSASTSDKPVYRLYAPSLMQHLYTTDAYEKSVLVKSGGWNDEGIAFYVSNTVTSSPVYRLYAPSIAVHQLTMDSYERSVLLASGRWNDEGIAWYQP